MGLRNETDKRIEGVKGTIHFDDLFGDRLRSLSFSFDDGLPPREAVEWNGTISHNEFIPEHVKLAKTSLEKLRVTWDPEAIVYSKEGTASEQ